MSAQDSVSTVYNCMLKGAADFLMKPIRKNELNNLWQHVWRRQAVCFLYLARQYTDFSPLCIATFQLLIRHCSLCFLLVE